MNLFAPNSRRIGVFSTALLLLLVCAAEVSPTSGAPVQLGDKTLFTVRWGTSNLTPEIRAKSISERLKRVAKSSQPIELRQVKTDVSTDIVAGSTTLVSVFEGDAAAERTSKDELARRWMETMRPSLLDYREQYTVQRRILRLILFLLTVTATLLAIRIVHRWSERIASSVAQRSKERLASSGDRLQALIRGEQIEQLVLKVFRVVRLLLIATALYLSFQILLALHPQTRAISLRMLEAVLGPIKTFGAAVNHHAPSLVFVLVVIIATAYLIKTVHYFFSKLARGEILLRDFKPSWATTTERLVAIMIVLLGILIAYPYIPGSDSAAFKGLTIFLGVLVSLGSSGTVANLITGIQLTYMDAFEVGDLVKIGNIVGVVTKTSLLTTRIQVRPDQLITIPNSIVLSGSMVNYSISVAKRAWISSTVGIGYDAPWRQVQAMLHLAASRTKGLCAEPAPFVVIVSLNQFDITYELNAYVERGEPAYLVKATLNANILDAFNEYGVQIMTPAYEHAPEVPVVVPHEKWFAAPAGTASTAQDVKPVERTHAEAEPAA